ncbi:MAG: nicotinate-nucleotide--dimethylbenzimidazole phosphoribosyltransferase [Pseudomonadota bacterium]|nr:nicotinate-nucleotide--dimethylbenzimidazole phosphoribosyltransferase [Pseudomonadota bacterium]
MPTHHIVSTANDDLARALRSAIDNKTKPRGSLGRLEDLALQLGLIQQTLQPTINAPTILVFAGDHGVVAEHISAYPQSVTWQMVENFLAGGAAINVLARHSNCQLQVIDAGVNHEFGARAGLIDRKIAAGTANFAQHAAMTASQCAQALQAGRELVAALEGNLVGFGEMGIGNTTSAAALLHRLCGIALTDCVGAGTGLDEEGVAHKCAVIARAVALHANLDDPIAILTAFGGFEIAMMVGAMLAAAERRMVLLIDGFIVTSALLVAAAIAPQILDYCVFAHCSDEHGHRAMLRHLDARVLLQLDLRLGEGTGCALALPLVQAAARLLAEMATFDSAQVSAALG